MLQYQIGITLLPDIGVRSAKKLIAYCGGVEAVFKESKQSLEKIPGIGKRMIESIRNQRVFLEAEREIDFIDKHDIQPLFYLDAAYPQRLKHCDDGPVLLYYKGTADLNPRRVISIVGTRKVSTYGQDLCEKLIADLACYDVQVVSGLAYGVDTCAHRASLHNGLETIGVLGHGLDRIYPSVNRKLATDMTMNGGLLTEFRSGTQPDAPNFPSRNRIVAGMADATLVVESGIKGGSLITADLAFHYNRDVMAFPGGVNMENSKGCNQLIQKNKAMLITSAADLINEMGWTDVQPTGSVQRQIFVELEGEEEDIVAILKEEEDCGVDGLSLKAGISMTSVSASLLSLELKGVVRCLPGNRYTLI